MMDSSYAYSFPIEQIRAIPFEILRGTAMDKG